MPLLMSNSREFIIERIRKARKSGVTASLSYKLSSAETDTPVFVQPTGDLCWNFSSELEKISGNCFIVKNDGEASFTLKQLVASGVVASLVCLDESIIARYGTKGLDFSTTLEGIDSSAASVTGCEFLISRTGSVMVSNANTSGRRPHVLPDTHIVIASSAQMVADLKDAIEGMQRKYQDRLPSWISNITGPSRTADIEKTLILGAHGPKKLIVIIVKQ